MYQKILLCYDGTIEGRRALRQGADVAIAMNSHAYLLAICRDLVSSTVPEGVTPELVGCASTTYPRKARSCTAIRSCTSRKSRKKSAQI
jgi:hypothetical protein